MRNAVVSTSYNVNPAAVGVEAMSIYNSIAAKNGGCVSQDLKVALLLTEKLGLNTGAPVKESDIVTGNYEICYGTEEKNIDLEADVVLTLRVKCGDESALAVLREANKGIFKSYIYKLQAACPYYRKTEEFQSVIDTAYFASILKNKVFSNGNVYKSTTKSYFDNFFNEVADMDAQAEGYTFSCGKNAMVAFNAAKATMKKENIEVVNVTLDMVKNHLIPSAYKKLVSAEGIYNMILAGNAISYEQLVTESSEDEEGGNSSELISSGVIEMDPVGSRIVNNLHNKNMVNAIKAYAIEKEDKNIMMLIEYYMAEPNTITYKYMMQKYGLKSCKAVEAGFNKAIRALKKVFQYE